MAEQNKKPRHPKFAIPKRYDLKLKTHYSAGTFAGAVKISVSVVSDTKYLVLDAVGLSVNPNSVSFSSRNKVMKAVRVELQAKEEKVVVEFKKKLLNGDGFLSMEFEGTLNTRIKGFITSIFKDINGDIVETKSLPAGARCCFSCGMSLITCITLCSLCLVSLDSFLECRILETCQEKRRWRSHRVYML